MTLGATTAGTPASNYALATGLSVNFMTSDEYRRHAFDAQNQAAGATDPIMKAGFERVAQCWLALAEQVEWMDRRYGASSPAVQAPETRASETREVQQQQVKPKDEGKKE
jgi:hypothetical protein